MGEKRPVFHCPPGSVSHASGQLRVKREERTKATPPAPQPGSRAVTRRLPHARTRVCTSSGVTSPCPQGARLLCAPLCNTPLVTEDGRVSACGLAVVPATSLTRWA